MQPPLPTPRSGDPTARCDLRAVVLAAGAAERMGRRPKCLLEFEGEPLIQRTLRALREAGVDPVVVVLGHHAATIAPRIELLGLTVVLHPDPDQGPVSSQRLGLAALPSTSGPVVVVLADQPLLDASAISELIEAWQRRPAGAEVLIPRVDGQRGNPVIFSASVREDILRGGAGLGCRQWQAAHPERVHIFESGHPGFVWDVDSEDDIRRLHEVTGRVLRWPAA